MKHDLRVQKTERAIREAFYQLIQQENLQKITVREIAELAQINKTTFYAHYATLDDFISTLELEVINTILQEINECILLFHTPELFVENLYHKLQVFTDVHCNVPYSSNRFNQQLSEALEAELKRQGIDGSNYQELKTVLHFLVCGILGLQRNNEDDVNAQIACLSRFVKGGISELNLKYNTKNE